MSAKRSKPERYLISFSGLRCNGIDNGCCTINDPCKLGDGDCDRDVECAGQLVCGNDNCPWGDQDDCCREGNCIIKLSVIQISEQFQKKLFFISTQFKRLKMFLMKRVLLRNLPKNAWFFYCSEPALLFGEYINLYGLRARTIDKGRQLFSTAKRGPKVFFGKKYKGKILFSTKKGAIIFFRRRHFATRAVY